MTKTQFILFEQPVRVVRAKFTGGNAHADFEIFQQWNGEHSIEPGMTPDAINNALESWDLEVQGSVKFDGCSNWETGNTWLHFCEAGDVLRLAEVMEDCRVRAAELIPGWCG